MSIRIEIELTSSSSDGSWTWRAAGARAPRGVLDGAILPPGAAVGDQLRVETEHDIDGIRVLSVVPGKEKAARNDLLQLLPAEETFEPVVQHRAPGGRGDGPRRPRRDRPDGERGDRRDRRDRRPGDGPRPADGARPGADRGDRPDRGERGDRRGAERRGGPRPDGEDRRRQRPHFTPPPEVPQRPKPKRLRPGKLRRSEVLESTPEEQRPIAELALQGIAAVRQRLREDNARLRAEGKPEMPEAAVLKMAEDLLPRLRVADWLDRAEAAQRQLEHLDLRDLRSVVASSEDPLVARDESTRALAAELKAALVTKQDEELALWLGDVEAALDVGRVVRALRLSSVPPKAGVPFPGALATRLAEATNASLQPTDGADRWAAVLEAAAFSPVRTLVAPTAAPEQPSDELQATVKRLAPLLPQVAALFGIEVPANAPTPKPLRPTTRRDAPKKQAGRPASEPRPRSGAKPPPRHAGGTAAEAPSAPSTEDAPAAGDAAATDADRPVDAAPAGDVEPVATAPDTGRPDVGDHAAATEDAPPEQQGAPSGDDAPPGTDDAPAAAPAEPAVAEDPADGTAAAEAQPAGTDGDAPAHAADDAPSGGAATDDAPEDAGH